MKTVIGVYDTHTDAIEAVQALKGAGYSNKNISLIGRVKGDDKGLETNDDKLVKTAGAEVGITTVAGATIGILTGIGIFAIPGLGFLYGAGALVGAIAGIDFGIIGGGIVSALTIPGMKEAAAKEYEKEIAAGKTVLVVQGSEEEIKEAERILNDKGMHSMLGAH